VWAFAFLFLGLALAVGEFALYAQRQKNAAVESAAEAKRQQYIAESRALAAQAKEIPCGQKTRRGPSPPEQSRFLFLINVSVSAAFN
jgi:hypothetical protein